MIKFSNKTDISLSVAVWLSQNDYDFVPNIGANKPSISASSILKPVKAIILGRRVEGAQANERDVAEFVHSKIGNSVHTAIENAWSHGNHIKSMKKLGYPDSVINRVVVNPTDDELKKVTNPIPVYMEQRSSLEINGYVISGKYDFMMDGVLEDFKTTSVFAYTSGTSDDKYLQQLSIYRLLNQDKVTKDYAHIQQIFKDWSKTKAERDKAYPPSQVNTVTLKLLSIKDTERLIVDKTNLIAKLENLDESAMPSCGDVDLWRDPAVFKYYANPNVLKRSTRNFDTYQEAEMYRREKAKGVIYEVKGTAKACSYCAGAPICQQYAQMKAAGLA